MKSLEKALRGHKAIVFLDLEGTQISHEMIELGSVLATLDNENHIRQAKEPFRIYVKAKSPVGHIVQRLTGIQDRLLAEKGVPFFEAQRLFRQYVGRYWKKVIFCTFGSHDLRIIEQTLLRNPDCDKEWASNIFHNHFDYAAWLSEDVEDEHGNSLSQENYLKLFEVPLQGRAHDAQDDAYNLMLLYDNVLKRKDILEKEYIKALSHLHKIPEPVRQILRMLNEGNTVTQIDLQNAIRKYFS